MNKKVISVIILAIVALVFDYLYAFGSLKQARINRSVNPQSVIPAKVDVKVNDQPASFNDYHNKDAQENYYSVKTPADWKLEKSFVPGSYNFSAVDVNAKVELMDVPDNTTLELYVLSQEEPRLKKETSGYQRIDYQKITVNGSQAFELTYQAMENGKTDTVIKTYITGQDRAGVVAVSVSNDQYSKFKPITEQFINSFTWENI
jgi:hypothetical protein